MLWTVLITPNMSTPASVEELIGPELLARLDRLTVLSRKLFAGKMPGERRSKRRGQSVEFDDYRPYTPGDDLRHLDWNVLARFDRLVLKLFREDEDQTLHLYLDASASMLAGGAGGAGGGSHGDESDHATPTKLVAAGRLMMALAAIGLAQRNRVVVTVLGLSAGGGGVSDLAPSSTVRRSRSLAPLRGRRNIRRVGEFLVRAIADATREMPRVDLAAELRTAAMTRRGGQGVAILISDLLVDDGLEDALGALVVPRGFDAACLQMLAPGEVDPALDRDAGLVGDLRLTDIESSKAVEVTLSRALLDRYRERFAAHQQRCIKACRARDITHIVVQSDADAADTLLGAVRRRGVLG